jgi:drug/metabolite transporter (DMT)-like permease
MLIGYITSLLTAGFQAGSDTASVKITVKDNYLKTLFITVVQLFLSFLLLIFFGINFEKFSIGIILLVIINTFLNTYGQVIFYKGISKGPLHLTLPFLSLTPIGVLIFEWLISKVLSSYNVILPESLQYLKTFSFPSAGILLGILLIVLSTGFISFKAVRDSGKSTTRKYTFDSARSVAEAAIFWWAISTIGDKIASKAVGPVPYICSALVIRFFVLLIITWSQRGRYYPDFVKNLKPVSVSGSLQGIAMALHNVSLLFLDAAVLSAIKRLQIVFGMLLGMKVFKEKPGFWVILAGIVGWLGVALTYLFR